MTELTELSDHALWQHVVEHRCEKAFAALMVRHRDPIWQLCTRMLRNRSDAEDAFQMTFLALLEHGGSIRSTDFGAWLYRVAYRASLRVQANRVATEAGPAGAPGAMAGSATDVLSEIEQAERAQLVERAVDSLPLKYRDVLVLHYCYGVARGEIAERLGITPQSVKARLSRGREALRPRLSRRGVTLGVAALLLGRTAQTQAAPPQLDTHTWDLAQQWLAGDPVNLDIAQFTDYPGKEFAVRSVNGVNVTLAAVATSIALFLVFEAGRAQSAGALGDGAASGVAALPQDTRARDTERDVPSNVVLTSHTVARPQTTASPTEFTGEFPLASLEGEKATQQTPQVVDHATAVAGAEARGTSNHHLPNGTWTRNSIVGSLAIHVEGRQVQFDFAGQGELAAIECSLRGEYSVASDGTIYGLIHSVDFDPGPLVEEMEQAAMLSMISDLPFSMRAHSDGHVLAVKSMTVGVPVIAGEADTAGMGAMAMYLCGTYHTGGGRTFRGHPLPTQRN